MSILSNQVPNMDSGETYECPHCHSNILTYNEATHDAVCARRHAAGNQRPVQPQVIRRESSSSGLPDSVEPNYANRRPQVREDRNLVNNKLVTCPNCEKSVREQNLNNHLANECEGTDKIPCEFCDQAISMSSYTHHIEDVHRREREEEQERHLARTQQQQEQGREPRQRSNERHVSPNRGDFFAEQNVPSNSQSQSNLQQDNSQQTSGGFMGFLKNILQSATQNRSEPREMPQQVERHLPSTQSQSQAQSQPQSGSRSLLSRLLGIPHEHEYEHEHEDERRRPSNMEDFFTQTLQNRRDTQRAQARASNRSTRTIRLGPHGTLIISSGGNAMEEPEDVWQSVGVPQRRQQSEYGMGPMSIGEMGPMGLILQMLAARGQGMPVAFNLNQEQLSEIENRGLSKEDIESLSVVKYDAEKNKNLSEDMKSCPICLDEFEDGVEIKFLWCLHRFHKKCIDQWLEKNTNCPICKKSFSEMNDLQISE